MAMEHDGTLSPEDEALFDTCINRHRKKLDRSTVLFIGMLVAISMLAGFCGGLPVALHNHNQCPVVTDSVPS